MACLQERIVLAGGEIRAAERVRMIRSKMFTGFINMVVTGALGE